MAKSTQKVWEHLKKYANHKRWSNAENYVNVKNYVIIKSCSLKNHFETIQMCFGSGGMFIRSIGMHFHR